MIDGRIQQMEAFVKIEVTEKDLLMQKWYSLTQAVASIERVMLTAADHGPEGLWTACRAARDQTIEAKHIVNRRLEIVQKMKDEE